jgi:hypothetical protein
MNFWDKFWHRLFYKPKDPMIEMIFLADKLNLEDLQQISDYCIALRKFKMGTKR